MDTIQKAKKVIRDAEERLQSLITEALAAQQYEDVQQVAQIAKRLSDLLTGEQPQFSPESVAEGKQIIAELEKRRGSRKDPAALKYIERKRKPASRRASRPKKGYPKFVRDGDRLVKVGWSKKNKSEYEHRVPYDALSAFVHHLEEKIEDSTVFDIDGLLPVSDASGGEVPGYQVYVVVAWLRDADVIEKKGRDGYYVRDKSVLRGQLDEQWNKLQARSA